MAVTVRRARAEDLPAVMNIAAECNTAAHWTGEHYEKLLSAGNQDSSLFLVITDQERVYGFIAGKIAADEWEIGNIAIDPERQCTGLGSHLLREFLNIARQQGHAVFLEVRESNLGARKLYKRFDFVEVGRRKSYYDRPQEDAILLKLIF